MMQRILPLILLLIGLSAQASLDKDHFFQVMRSGSKEKIKAERSMLEKQEQTAETRAYLGAILMQEAQFLGTPVKKLEHFKKGRLLLEAEISKNNSLAEYRFLRLIIQENCPRILNYRDNLETDAALIIKNFPKMNDSVKNAVKNYSKKSTILPAAKLPE